MGFDFSLGENPWGCSPKVIEALRNATPAAVACYPDNFGDPLRHALSQCLSMPPEWFCVGTGALGVLDLVFRSVAASHTRCLLPALSFPSYTILARLYRMERVMCPMGPGLTIDVSALSNTVSHDRPNLTIIANPNNPTGKCISRSEVDALVSATQDVGLLVLDEANIEYCPSSFTSWYGCHDWPQHVIVVRSFSKAHGLASLRIGYAIAHPNTINTLMKAWIDFPVTQLALQAACAALSDPNHVYESARKMEESRRMLTLGLSEMGLSVYQSDSNYLLVDLAQSGFNSSTLAARLRLENVGVLDGASFLGLGNAFIRISPRTLEDNNRLLTAMKAVLRGLERSSGK